MKKSIAVLLGTTSLLLAVSACTSDDGSPQRAPDAKASTQSLAAHCGVPTTARLESIAKQFAYEFKDDGLEDAYEYRIDEQRSVVSAVVKRPTQHEGSAPTAWLLNGDTISHQLTGTFDYRNRNGGFVIPPPPTPGGNAEQWEFEWPKCESIVPAEKRTSWAPTRDEKLADAPPPCPGASPVDKMPGNEFQLHDGLKIIDIYSAATDVTGGTVVGGNVIDQSGSVVARGALWLHGYYWRSLNEGAKSTTGYKMAMTFPGYEESMATVSKCISAVHR